MGKLMQTHSARCSSTSLMIHDELHGEHRSRPMIGVSLCWSAGRVLAALKAAQSSMMAVSMKAVAFYKNQSCLASPRHGSNGLTGEVAPTPLSISVDFWMIDLHLQSPALGFYLLQVVHVHLPFCVREMYLQNLCCKTYVYIYMNYIIIIYNIHA